MDRIRIRPRYTFSTSLKKEEVLAKLREGLDKDPLGLNGKFVKPLVVITVPEEKRHFWSPELSLDVEGKDSETEIRCTLGPHSSIWTMFIAFYAFSVLIGIAGVVLGISQLTLGMSTYGFWLIPVSIVLLASAYGIALTGQRLAYDQMLELRSFIKRTLKDEHSKN